MFKLIRAEPAAVFLPLPGCFGRGFRIAGFISVLVAVTAVGAVYILVQPNGYPKFIMIIYRTCAVAFEINYGTDFW